MLKKIIGGAAVSLCALTAQAADQVFQWSYTGFLSTDTGAWSPNATTGGKFVVNDLNADGIYDLSEVISFDYDVTDESKCGDRYTVCSLSTFSFAPKGTLAFDYKVEVRWGPGTALGWWVETGRNWGWYESYPTDGGMSIYSWDPRTVGTITAVPEPHTYLMLWAGLLALGAGVRRKEKMKG